MRFLSFIMAEFIGHPGGAFGSNLRRHEKFQLRSALRHINRMFFHLRAHTNGLAQREQNLVC